MQIQTSLILLIFAVMYTRSFIFYLFFKTKQDLLLSQDQDYWCVICFCGTIKVNTWYHAHTWTSINKL